MFVKAMVRGLTAAALRMTAVLILLLSIFAVVHGAELILTNTGAGSVTVPAGDDWTNVTIQCWGGGGGGGSCYYFSRLGELFGGGGGGGGGYCSLSGYGGVGFTIPAGTYNYTIGAGGTQYSNGGNTQWDYLGVGGSGSLIAYGGASGNTYAGGSGGGGGGYIGPLASVGYTGGGGASSNAAPSGGGGGGAAGSSGNGVPSYSLTGGNGVGGGGNGGNGGQGNGAFAYLLNGYAGTAPGGGGGGPGSNLQEDAVGNAGNGGNGEIIITYTLPATITLGSMSSTTIITGGTGTFGSTVTNSAVAGANNLNYTLAQRP